MAKILDGDALDEILHPNETVAERKRRKRQKELKVMRKKIKYRNPKKLDQAQSMDEVVDAIKAYQKFVRSQS